MFNLRQRLLALSILPSTLLAMALGGYFAWFGVNALEVELRERGMAIVRYLAPISEYGIIAGQQESLQNLTQTTLQQPNVKAIAIVNRNGRTLAVSGRISLSSDQLRSAPDTARVVGENAHWVAFGAPVWRSLADADEFSESEERKRQPEVIGQLFVEFDKTEVSKRQSALLFHGSLLILFGLMLVALLALGFADSIIRPIQRLLAAHRKLGDGALEVRIPASSVAELGQLEAGFNSMASHFETTTTLLKERLAQAEQHIDHLSTHDILTGLVSRGEFDTRLADQLSRVHGGQAESSLIFLKLDKLEPVSLQYGSGACDELIRQLTAQLLQSLPNDGLMGRIGHDEFGLLLPACHLAQAQSLAEDLRRQILSYRFVWQGRIFAIGAHAGLATINRYSLGSRELFLCARQACIRARSEGLGMQVAERQLPHKRNELDAMERIRSVLRNRTLLFDAIPVQAAGQALPQTYWVEICARIDARRDHWTPMRSLLRDAERCGQEKELEQITLNIAGLSILRALERRQTLYCIVPISDSSLCKQATIDNVEETTSRLQIPARQLILAIRDEAIKAFGEQGHAFCQQLRSRTGAGLLIDDFAGTPPAFARLATLQPSVLRIDQNLLSLTDETIQSALLGTLVQLANTYETLCLASDIGDPELQHRLTLSGIQLMQGSVIAPQEPFDDWVEGVLLRLPSTTT